MKRRRNIFYGWWIVACGFGIQFISGAVLSQAYGAYVVLLREEFGWSKTLLSSGYSMARVESGMLGPLQGWLNERFGTRAVMVLGTLIFGGGFILFSQIQTPVTFFMAVMLMFLGSSLGGYFSLSIAVINWFSRRRSTAVAVMQSGMAIGGLFVPITVLSMEAFGWRTTAFASGILVIGVGLPLVRMIRHRPEDMGLQVDGGLPPHSTPDASTARPALHVDADFDTREALRTRAFWFISIGHAAALLIVGAVSVHVVAHLNEGLGYSLGTAALVVTLITLGQLMGQLLGGFLGDRFEKRLIVTGCMIAHATAIILVAYAVSFVMVIAFAILHGVAWGTRGPIMQTIRADYFGRRSYGMISGYSSLIIMFGQILGPIIAGVLADQTGDYVAGFTLLGILAAIGSLFWFLAKPPQRPTRQPTRFDQAGAVPLSV